MLIYHYSTSGFGDVLQMRWLSLLDVIGDDPMKLWIIGGNVFIFTTYVLFGAFLMFLDNTKFPKFLYKYKIQPEQNNPIDNKRLWKALRVVFLNLTVFNVATSWFIYEIGLKHQTSNDIRTLPSFSRVLRDNVLCFVFEELMYYYIHLFLHHKAIYKYLHKKHHEWTAPIAAVTLYAHPVEHVVANVLPIGISMILLDMHVTVGWMVLTLATLTSMINHTGYRFPWLGETVRFHDYHHTNPNYNYGVVGWLDKLHGTHQLPLDKAKQALE